MKKTAIAPSNIAFIKYWGKKDEALRLPSNGSISMNLSNLRTTTTVEFNEQYMKDEVVIEGSTSEKDILKVISHLDLIRSKANIKTYAKVLSENNFPSSTGLSSSASGFAALTVAATSAAGLMLNEKELSILARIGSGSACRSIPSGFVEWHDGNDSESSYAESIFPSAHWDIVDIVAVVSREKKEVSTTDGHRLASTSPFNKIRLSHMPERIAICKKTIKEKNFSQLGELMEKEALEMHAIMLTSNPSLIYWLPTTVLLIKKVAAWRRDGFESYFTINTGQDVHIICQKKDAETMVQKLKLIPEVVNIIQNSASEGAHLSEDHLF